MRPPILTPSRRLVFQRIRIPTPNTLFQTSRPTDDEPYSANNYLSQYELLRLEDQALGFMDMMRGKVLHVPITTHATHIIDIGCGTGVHTRLLGSTFPNAQIYGVDLSSVSEQATPSNVEFIQGDIKKLVKIQDPRFAPNSMDCVFSRLLVCGMTDWQGYVDDVGSILKPGGWTEMQDYDLEWFSKESGVLCSDSWKWLAALRKVQEQKGCDFRCGSNIKSYMENAGLVDVQQIVYIVPNGTWMETENPETNRIMKHAVKEYPLLYHHAIPKILQGVQSAQQIRNFQAENMRTLGNHDEEKFLKFTVTIGRKPEV